MRFLRDYLNSLTMYQVVLRHLVALLAAAILCAGFGKIPFGAGEIITTLGVAFTATWISQACLSRLFRRVSNRESWQITALILALVVGPGTFESIWLPVTAAAAAAMLSKFVLRVNGQHIFNPAAFGIVAIAIAIDTGSSWWVGIWPLSLITIVGGVAVGYKIRRITTVGAFLLTYLALFLLLNGTALDISTNLKLLQGLILNSPLIFLATVMLIEPATSPTGHRARFVYVVIVAATAASLQRFLPEIAYSFEAAILLGNGAARLLERHNNFVMTLVRRERLTDAIESLFFEPSSRVTFTAGQFLEWTVPHANPDSRGTRRWFTIASAPTEPLIQLTTRFSDKPSSFKATLRSLAVGQSLTAHGLEGDFVLPEDRTKALVFIAGGIGITPFRSMLKSLLDKNDARDITLFYAARAEEDLVFQDIISNASEAFGLKYVPVVTEASRSWKGRTGQVSAEILLGECPTIKQADVFVSGPEAMVEDLTVILRSLGVPNSAIHQDFFPGYLTRDVS